MMKGPLAPIRVRKMAPADAEDLAMHYLNRVKAADQGAQVPVGTVGRAAAAYRHRAGAGDGDPEMVGEVLDPIVSLAGEGTTIVCVTHEWRSPVTSPSVWSSWTPAASSIPAKAPLSSIDAVRSARDCSSPRVTRGSSAGPCARRKSSPRPALHRCERRVPAA